MAGGGLSLMNAMISTEQDMRTAPRFPPRWKRLAYHHQVHRVLSIVWAIWSEWQVLGKRVETDEVWRTDLLGTSHTTEVRTGGQIVSEKTCLEALGTP